MADLKISALTSATTPLAGTEVLPIVQSSTTKKVSIDDVTAGRNVAMQTGTANQSVAAGVDLYTLENTNSTAVTTKYAGIKYRGRDTVNSGKDSAYVRAYPVDADFNNSYLSFWTRTSDSVTEKARINSAGNIVIVNSGNGIDFSATSGSGVSELLADYEEGTFTPVISGNPTPGAATYTRQLGTYVKVGRTVWFTISCAWTAHTGGTNITVTGLPFVSSSTNNAPTAFSVFAGDYALTALNVMVAYIVDNSSTVVVQQIPVGGGSLTNVALDTSASILISGTYYS